MVDVPHDAADIGAWLRAAREELTVSGGGGGRYMASDVDAFLAAVEAELSSDALPDIARMLAGGFRGTRLRAGYDKRADGALIRELRQRLGDGNGTAAPGDSGTEAMIARITNAQFRTTRKDGYDERAVDDFLDGAIQALRLGDPPAPPSGFATARLRPGYNKQDVDAFMSEIWPPR